MTKERLQEELKNLSQQKLEAVFQLQAAKDHLKNCENVVSGVDGALLIVGKLSKEAESDESNPPV